MNIIALLILAVAAICFLWEGNRLYAGRPRPVYLIAAGLFFFVVGFILTFVIQTPWGQVVIH